MKLTPPVKDIFYEPGTGSGFMVQLNTNTTELNAMDPCWKNICDKKMFLIAKVQGHQENRSRTIAFLIH